MNKNNGERADAESELDYVDDLDEWDTENPIITEGRPVTRTTFSVRMHPRELGEISSAARAANMKTGEFIRNAALAAARGGDAGMNATEALIRLAAQAGMRVTFEPVAAKAEQTPPASAAH
jgi:hypothetical protein